MLRCTDRRDSCFVPLTRWGRVTHICVVKLTIGSDNGLSPGRRQAIIWTNAEILLIGPLGTNFSEILIGIQTFAFKKMHFKMSSAKWRPFCLGLNVLNISLTEQQTRHWIIVHYLTYDVDSIQNWSNKNGCKCIMIDRCHFTNIFRGYPLMDHRRFDGKGRTKHGYGGGIGADP